MPFSDTSSVAFTVGTPVTVIKLSGVQGEVGAIDGGSAAAAFSVFTDPTFEIDPSFPFASDFELVFSTDDVGTAPEPSTFGLMVLGIIGISTPKLWRRFVSLGLNRYASHACSGERGGHGALP
ncbi:MAG TPA: PEP-CTERM sorting domain-containing protein [Bryobacteraceae bacterium]